MTKKERKKLFEIVCEALELKMKPIKDQLRLMEKNGQRSQN
jgi:hypothetical protein